MGSTRGPVDLLSAASVLTGTPATYPPAAPQIGRVLGTCSCCAAACSRRDELCRQCGAVSIDDTTWLSRDTAIVTWRFDHSGFASTSIVSVEFEGADPSVGIMSGGFIADSDGPAALDELVAEDASLRAADEYGDRDDDGWYDEDAADAADAAAERGQW